MATNSSAFSEFLSNIRPTEAQEDALQDGHRRLRERLHDYEPLKNLVLSDFLQGSYRRSTSLRPSGKRRSDVDIVVVTKLHEIEWTPARALDLFEGFAKKHYAGKYRMQGRSIGISMSAVDMDLVITSAPTEAALGVIKLEALVSDDELEDAPDLRLNDRYIGLSRRQDAAPWLLSEAAKQPEWKLAPLRIPDREAQRWEDTHPLAQLQYTRDKNARCSGHLLGVVRAIKWWRYDQFPNMGHPRSYPLERIATEFCPDGIASVAEGVTRTLEAIAARGAAKPRLPDYGTHRDVLERVSAADYATLHDVVAAAAPRARRALDEVNKATSRRLWHEFFGTKFPPPEDSGGSKSGGFTPRGEGPSEPSGSRFA